MKRFSLLIILIILSTACGDIQTTSDETDRDESFLVDGKSDATGIEDGTLKADAILTFVNSASVDELLASGLTERTTNQIINARMKSGGLRTLADLDAVPYMGTDAFESLVRFVRDNGLFKRTIHGVLEGSAESDAILELVGFASQRALDVDVALTRIASTNIVEIRVVSPIETLAQLADIDGVNAATFRRLLQYVEKHAHGQINHDRFIKALASSVEGVDATESDYFEYVERATAKEVPNAVHKMAERYIEETVEDWDLYNEPGLFSAEIVAYYMITDGNEAVGYIVTVSDQIAVEDVATTGVHIFATGSGRVVSKRGWSK